jgi:hypothetical protein
MSRPAVSLLALALLLGPATAHAQIDLAWNDCITQPGQAGKITYACDGSRNGARYRVVMSFSPPVELPKFVGFQARVRVLAAAPVLPDFWRLAVGECRDGSLRFPSPLDSVGTGMAGACQNPWAGAVTGGGFQYTSETPAVYYGEILFAFARIDSVVLHAGQDYVAGAFTLDMDSDEDSCSGCGIEACLNLDYIELFQIPGTPPQDIYTLTSANRRQLVGWQTGIQPANCYVPVRNTTWGAVKALYR